MKNGVSAGLAFLAAAIVAAHSSCTREISGGADGGVQEESRTTLTACISQDGAMPPTKIYIDGSYTDESGDIRYPVKWSAGDSIGLLNSDIGLLRYGLTGGDSTTRGSFTGPSLPSDLGYIYGIYPLGLITGTGGNWATLRLPLRQHYSEGTFDRDAMCMTAKGNPWDVMQGLTFEPYMSVLKVQLTGADADSVSRIVVYSGSPDINLSGEMTYDYEDGQMEKGIENGSPYVELVCDQPQHLDENVRTFHIVLPPKACYENDTPPETLTVYVVSPVGHVMEKKMSVTDNSLNSLESGHIMKMPSLNFVTENMIKYGDSDDAPLAVMIDYDIWAPVNCGYSPSNIVGDVENGHPYGLLYQWGMNHGFGYGAKWEDIARSESPAENVGKYELKSSKFDRKDNSPSYFYTDKRALDSTSKSHVNYKRILWKARDNDPCPDGWRVADSTEMKSLVRTGRGSFDKGDGTVQGGYFRGSDSLGRAEIFLPVAGYVYSPGSTLIFYRRSKYQSGDNADMATMYCVSNACISREYIFTFSIAPGSKSISKPFFTNGFPVRCVKVK